MLIYSTYKQHVVFSSTSCLSTAILLYGTYLGVYAAITNADDSLMLRLEIAQKLKSTQLRASDNAGSNHFSPRSLPLVVVLSLR